MDFIEGFEEKENLRGEKRRKKWKEKTTVRDLVFVATVSVNSSRGVSFSFGFLFGMTSRCPARVTETPEEDGHVNGLVKVNDNVLLRFSAILSSPSNYPF